MLCHLLLPFVFNCTANFHLCDLHSWTSPQRLWDDCIECFINISSEVFLSSVMFICRTTHTQKSYKWHHLRFAIDQLCLTVWPLSVRPSVQSCVISPFPGSKPNKPLDNMSLLYGNLRIILVGVHFFDSHI